MVDTKQITKYILEQLKEGNINKDTALNLVKQLNVKDAIAVVGMACMFGDSDDYNDMWDYMVNMKTDVERCSKKRIDLIKDSFPNIVSDKIEKHCKGGYLKNIEQFDYRFFSFSKADADLLYPGIRIALEVAYRALEDAGYLGEKARDNCTGVYIGNNYTKDTIFSYLNLCLQKTNYAKPFDAMLYNWSSGLATRISNYFNLKGPSYIIDASCPSSVVAIANACNAIKQGLCTSAIAGGMYFDMSPLKVLNTNGWIFNNEDGIVAKLFDDGQMGAYPGEGFGLIVLKPLVNAIKDRDRIHAVICSITHNNNGSSGEYTRSSPEGIKQAVIAAIREAQIDVADIGLMMGEGYPNKMEEGLELAGIIGGFNNFTKKRQYCCLGGCVANFGYLQSAVGIFNTMIEILAMKNKLLPPLCHFTQPTGMINLCKSPFYINDICKRWDCDEGKTRYAANYSYGYGGTNTVMVLKEATEPKKYDKPERDELFILTAKTKKSLDANVNSYISFFSRGEKKNLSEICFNACTRRILFEEYRLAIMAKDTVDLLAKLKAFKSGGHCSEVFYEEKTNTQRAKARFESTAEKDKPVIAKEFTDGTNYNFSELFNDLTIGFCELPRYVFDKERCWCEKTTALNMAPAGK